MVKNRSLKIKDEEQNAEDLSSGLVANYRAFDLFQSCNRYSVIG